MNALYTIRPLEWLQGEQETENCASTLIGSWVIFARDSGWAWRYGAIPKSHPTATAEEARRQCEKDYRKRLLTMLEPVISMP